MSLWILYVENYICLLLLFNLHLLWYIVIFVHGYLLFTQHDLLFYLSAACYLPVYYGFSRCTAYCIGTVAYVHMLWWNLCSTSWYDRYCCSCVNRLLHGSLAGAARLRWCHLEECRPYLYLRWWWWCWWRHAWVPWSRGSETCVVSDMWVPVELIF